MSNIRKQAEAYSLMEYLRNKASQIGQSFQSLRNQASEVAENNSLGTGAFSLSTVPQARDWAKGLRDKATEVPGNNGLGTGAFVSSARPQAGTWAQGLSKYKGAGNNGVGTGAFSPSAGNWFQDLVRDKVEAAGNAASSAGAQAGNWFQDLVRDKVEAAGNAASSAGAQAGNWFQGLRNKVEDAGNAARDRASEAAETGRLYHPATPQGRAAYDSLRNKHPEVFKLLAKVRDSDAFQTTVTKPVGRVVTNVKRPFGYHAVEGEDIKDKWKDVVADKSGLRPITAEDVSFSRSDANYLRTQAYRKMFGLPADMSVFRENSDGTYDFSPEYKRRMLNDMYVSDTKSGKIESRRTGRPVLDLLKEHDSAGSKRIDAYDAVMGNVKLYPQEGGAYPSYAYRDPWDFTLNPGDTSPSAVNLQRWLVSKITEPVVFKGDLSTGPGAYDDFPGHLGEARRVY